MKARFTAGGMIKQINEVFEKNANNSLRDKGLTMSQFRVLLLLNFNSEGMLTMKEIEKALMCAQSTVHGLTARLEEKNLVAACTDPTDKRIRVIGITEKGREYCAEARLLMRQVENGILSPLTDEEKKQFMTYLSRIVNGIE
ncbi:MAG: MarR family transcriptional regulator [Firmicutes bacterium]|nr:MarR family transcriptional regulator [Bacillota bacterium]